MRLMEPEKDNDGKEIKKFENQGLLIKFVEDRKETDFKQMNKEMDFARYKRGIKKGDDGNLDRIC